MMKSIAAALFLSATFATASQADQVGRDFNETCEYFESRSAGLSDGPDAPWIVQISSSCSTALDRMSASAPENDPDRLFLTRLDRFRCFVLVFAANRLRAHKEAEAAAGKPLPRHRIFPTQTGEYLIARKLEIDRAWDIWASDTGVVIAGMD